MFLPDVNLWLALAFESHAHHPAAKSWYESASDDLCFFCRMTQQGFLRLATNPAALGDDAVSMVQAWQLYDTILNDTRIIFALEPSAVESSWREFTRDQTFSPKAWNDGYLAAFAHNAGYELVTFDQGFAKFPALNATILTQ